MKTTYLKSKNNRIDDPCCEESQTRGNTLKRLRQASRWFFWIVALLLAVLFTLGYFLDPSTIRILWLLFSGVMLIIVLPVLTFWRRWMKHCNDELESNQ